MCYCESRYVNFTSTCNSTAKYSHFASIVPQACSHQANITMRLRRLQSTGLGQLFVRRLAKTVDKSNLDHASVYSANQLNLNIEH